METPRYLVEFRRSQEFPSEIMKLQGHRLGNRYLYWTTATNRGDHWLVALAWEVEPESGVVNSSLGEPVTALSIYPKMTPHEAMALHAWRRESPEVPRVEVMDLLFSFS